MNNKNIIRSVVCILAIDGKIDSQEHQFLREISQKLNVSNETLTEILEDSKQGKRSIHIPNSPEEKHELMSLLVEAASIDGIFAPQEQNALKKIATKINLDINDFQKLVNKYFVASSSSVQNTSQSQELKKDEGKRLLEPSKIEQKQELNEGKDKRSPAATKITFTPPKKDRSRGMIASIKKTLKKVTLALFLWIILFIILSLMFPKFRHEVTWLWVSYDNQPQKYAWFIESFPQARHIEKAKELYDRQTWENALNRNRIQAYDEYLLLHPKGKYIKNAYANIEKLFWQKIDSENTIESYQKYINKYPEGQFLSKANERLESLIWKQTQERDKLEGYKDYLNSYPNGLFIAEAKERLLWEKVKEKNTIEDSLDYIERYPDGLYVDQAERSLWQQVLHKNTSVAYQQYLNAFPEGRFASSAHNRQEKKRIREQVEDNVWRDVTSSGSIVAYLRYLERYPDGEYSHLAREKFNSNPLWDRALWEVVANENFKESYKQYINIYPTGEFIGIANEKILWLDAVQNDTEEAYAKYLNAYPSGEFADQAQKGLGEFLLWQYTLKKNNVEAYYSYAETYPNGKFIAQVKEVLRENKEWDEWLWKIVTQKATEKAFKYYIEIYPNGKFVTEATRRISAQRKISHTASEITIRNQDEIKVKVERCQWTERWMRNARPGAVCELVITNIGNQEQYFELAVRILTNLPQQYNGDCDQSTIKKLSPHKSVEMRCHFSGISKQEAIVKFTFYHLSDIGVHWDNARSFNLDANISLF